jgi:hypothetical protein
LASCPDAFTLTRVVTPVRRFRTKMSGEPFASPTTRLLADE